MRHRDAMKRIQDVCVERCYRARDVLKMELAGAEAIQGLLAIFVHARCASRNRCAGCTCASACTRGSSSPAPRAYERLLRLTDHVSGMTDHYAVRLYRELRGMRYPGGRD